MCGRRFSANYHAFLVSFFQATHRPSPRSPALPHPHQEAKIEVEKFGSVWFSAGRRARTFHRSESLDAQFFVVLDYLHGSYTRQLSSTNINVRRGAETGTFLIVKGATTDTNPCRPVHRLHLCRKQTNPSLTAKYFAEFNEGAFGGALSNVKVAWSARLSTTAGVTKSLRRVNPSGEDYAYLSTVELSTKVLDSEDKLQQVGWAGFCLSLSVEIAGSVTFLSVDGFVEQSLSMILSYSF